MPAGRPKLKFTKEQVAEVATLAAVLTIEQMADYFGIGRNSFTNIMQRQPELKRRTKEARQKRLAQSLKVCYSKH